MDVSAILAEWGPYYRAGGQGVQDLMVKLMEKSATEQLFNVLPTDKNILERVTAETSRVLQAFQKKFTPLGTTTFKPTKIRLQKLKIDLTEYPDDLEDSWLGFLASNDLDRTTWPFVKWWLEINILDAAKRDLEKDEIFWGVPAAIVDGTPSAPRTSLLGLRKQINDGITATTITPTSMGAIPTDAIGFVNYVEDFIKQIPELLRDELDILVMRTGLRDLYREGMVAKYNMNYGQVANTDSLRLYPQIQVKGVVSHAGSDKIWTTPPWNRQRGIKKPGNESIFKVEAVDRNVKAYTDYYKGNGFWINQYLQTNDLDLV